MIEGIKQIARERAEAVLTESKFSHAFENSIAVDVLLEGECVSERDIFGENPAESVLVNDKSGDEASKIERLIDMLPEDDSDDDIIEQIINADDDEGINGVIESGMADIKGLSGILG